MTREARQSRCPETVLGWIPWYGEGSLSEDQEGAVAAHAAECAECRAEIDMIAGALFEIDADLPDPDLAFEALTARIAERAKTAADLETDSAAENALTGAPEIHEVEFESMTDLEQLARWALEEGANEEGGPDPATAQVIQGPWSSSKAFAAAAACVLVSLGAVGGALYSSSPLGLGAEGDPKVPAGAEAYTLATAAEPAAVSTGALVDVVFRESASAGDISALLRDADAEIVSGPSALGVYRLRVSGSDAENEAAGSGAAFLARLRGAAGTGQAGLATFAEKVPGQAGSASPSSAEPGRTESRADSAP